VNFDSVTTEASRIRALLDEIGLESIIDVHTHFMPKRVLDKVWAYFDNLGELTGQPWPIRYRLPEQSRVQLLDTFSVSAFTSLLYHTSRIWRSGSTPGLPSSPMQPRDACTPRRSTPKNGRQSTSNAPSRTEREYLRRTCKSAVPELQLIIAHMGLPEYREFLDLAHEFPGVYLDTTMVFTDFTEARDPFPSDCRGDLAVLGDKILFGSDYPNIPYPYHHAVESIVNLDLGPQWCRFVLHDNAARLFDIRCE
jgi:hypothetical protein